MTTPLPPEVGEPAGRPLPNSLWDGRPLVLCFLRHVGCPFAEASARHLVALSERHGDRVFVAVSQGASWTTNTWCEAIGGEGLVTWVYDQERVHFARWGLGPTGLAHVAGPAALRALVATYWGGSRHRRSAGSRWQQAGSFALDRDLVVRWRHLPRHAGDQPDLEAALRALSA